MMELMIGGIAVKAAVLSGILFLVARHEADFDFKKLVLVSCGITLVSFALEAFLEPELSKVMPLIAATAVTVILALAFMTFMIVRFCWVRVWKGALVTILFMLFSIGLSFAESIIAAKINQSVEQAGGSVSVMEQNTQEAVQMFQEMAAMSSSQMLQQALNEGMTSMPGAAAAGAGERPAAVLPQEVPVAPPPAVRSADELPAFARTPEWQAAQAKIKVSAVLVERDGSNTAIVNGEVLGIGDILTVEVKRKLYRFKMAELTTDWVAWDPMGETDAN